MKSNLSNPLRDLPQKTSEDVKPENECVKLNNNYASSWKEVGKTPSTIGSRIRWFMRNAALTALAALNSSCDAKFLRPLFCHNVFDDQKVEFEALIEELMNLGTFVNTATCLDMLRGKTPIDGRYFHLSFDDGFRNVAINAVPILKKYNVPAIVFVPTSFVGADWQTANKYCLEMCRYRAVLEMLQWKDLEKMLSAGFEVGSHTRTHARFSSISKDPILLHDEIAGSKQEIEDKLGIKCNCISWPYGTKLDSDEVSLAMVEEAGYEACFGAFRGSIQPRLTNVYSIPRHHFEVEWPFAHIKYFLSARLGHVT